MNPIRLASCIIVCAYGSFLTALVVADGPAATEKATKAVADALQWVQQPVSRRVVATAGSTMKLEHLTYDQKRPIRLWLIELDASAPGVSFVATEPNPRKGEDGRQFETLCETTLAFAERTGAQLAINTSAFGPGRGSPLQPMDVAGFAAYEGNVYSKSVRDYGAMFIDKDGRIRLKAPPLEGDDVWHAIPGFRMLLDDGKPAVKDHVFATAFGNINPRTAVGVDRTGQKLWIVIADGRQRERTLGMTLPELAAVFQWVGAWDALNLDGGGSSTLVMQDGTGKHRLVNEAINGGKVGVLRQVAHNLGIKIASTPIEWKREALGATPTIPMFKLSTAAQQLRLPHDVKVDADLQALVERIDGKIAEELSIPKDQRAFGVVDLRTARIAMIDGDSMFYGASVPKIAIVLEYLRQHPEFVKSPDPTVMRELQRVIKRSDNELAAKYGRLADIDRIQQMLQSSEFLLYDNAHGGGLWCGKYYGSPEPRTGDPLEDLSHAATVRQCLRYYLMMEQDRLVSPEISARLREIFAAPWLELHDDNFAAGLKGMNATLIRKNGLWEDWHLDTARVALPDGPVLLAGIAHHPQGQQYLKRMARDLIMALDQSVAHDMDRPWRGYRHITLELQGAGDDDWSAMANGTHRDRQQTEDAKSIALNDDGRATIEFEPLIAPFKFNEVLVSWNLNLPSNVSYAVDVAVGTRFDDSWSPWMLIDQLGPNLVDEKPNKQFDGGKVDVDYFVSEQRFDRLRVRLRLLGQVKQSISYKMERMNVTLSDTTRRADSWQPELPSVSEPSRDAYTRRLPVPHRSQYTGRSELRGRICSPTSLSMVLAYHGIDKPTATVVEACLDPVHDIYGNWPRNIAAAFQLGAPGYLTRINDWAVVQQHIAAGRPVIASIRFDRPELIKAAPYKMTNGHLIVICGFDEDGNVFVNDSAVASEEEGRRTYDRAQLEAAWFGGSAGVTYVLDSGS